MGFFETARKAGAEAYGVARAEKYGKQEKAKRVAAVVAIIALALFVLYLYQLGQGVSA